MHKAIIISQREGEKVVECARRNNTFLMEAMGTRFLPAMKNVRE